MKRRYRSASLPWREAQFLLMVLMDELEIQEWYALTYSSLMEEEVILFLQ